MRAIRLIAVMIALLPKPLFAANHPQADDQTEAEPVQMEALAVQTEPVASAQVRPTRGTVRVIHLHTESPSVQAFYGYRADARIEATPSTSHTPHRHRHERMVEQKSGAAGSITYTHGALNSTQVAYIDADGNLALECLDGDVSDVREEVLTRFEAVLESGE